MLLNKYTDSVKTKYYPLLAANWQLLCAPRNIIAAYELPNMLT